jgi:HlyD family secretion protein
MTAFRAITKNAKYLFWILAAGTAFVVLKLTLLSPPSVRLVTVANRDLTAQVYGNGTVEAKVVVDVSSKITGRIVALFADQGDHVQPGRLVAKLEDEDVGQQALQAEALVKRASATLLVEEANLRKARSNAELAKHNAARFKMLADRDLIPQIDSDQYENANRVATDEVERCRSAVDAARMELEAARANLGVAGSRRSDTLVYAPQDGIIISRELEQGAIVSPGLPIFRMAAPRNIWVKANVDESLLHGIAVGQRATILLRSSKGDTFPGRVVRIGRESDRVTEELEVDVSFDPPLTRFHLGEQAEVYILSESKKGCPSLPITAVATQGKRRGVWMVQAGKLKWKEIVLGIEDRNAFVEVVSGLAPGEAVAVAPAEQMQKFQDGMKVKTAK